MPACPDDELGRSGGIRIAASVHRHPALVVVIVAVEHDVDSLLREQRPDRGETGGHRLDSDVEQRVVEVHERARPVLFVRSVESQLYWAEPTDPSRLEFNEIRCHPAGVLTL